MQKKCIYSSTSLNSRRVYAVGKMCVMHVGMHISEPAPALLTGSSHWISLCVRVHIENTICLWVHSLDGENDWTPVDLCKHMLLQKMLTYVGKACRYYILLLDLKHIHIAHTYSPYRLGLGLGLGLV